MPTDHMLIYDDDHYYLSSVLADLLHNAGWDISIVTPAPVVAYWSQYTLEQEHIHQRMIKAGTRIFTQQILKEIQPEHVSLAYSVSGRETELEVDSVVLVTDRLPTDELYHELKPAQKEGRIKTLRVIGDAEAPGIIAQAVFSGHLAARQMDEKESDDTPFKIERENT